METNQKKPDVFGMRGRGVVELTPEEYELDDLASEIARTLQDCEELSSRLTSAMIDGEEKAL